MATQRWDLLTGQEDKQGKTHWAKCGVMFPQKDGGGFSIVLFSHPVNGRLIAREPRERDERQQSTPGYDAPLPF